MAHILVTGAAGFIGSHTADQLLAAGHDVTGVDNFRTGRRANLAAALASPRFALVERDVAAAGQLNDIVARVRPDAIIHLAALVSVQESIANPELNYALNVQATHHVAEAARLHGVRRIVFASSAAIYGDATDLPIRETTATHPISPYGAAKLASEALLLGHGAAFGITVRCQRYFNVFGPRQDPASPYSGVISIFDRRYREGKAVTIFGDGRQTRDFISVHDVARANVIAATKPGIDSGAANICTGRATTLNDVVGVFSRSYPAVPACTHAAARTGDIVHSLGASDAAAAALGFRAEVDVETGLQELIRLG
ncbi:NAD-dependent epimerase/dehydratase family protein [Horticoccus sp. 23ND18S-11]|uniref:NAD-dependent epimerase/dehydratase family protein n=1 Tax=Horticoccus sp. 23ND18S-11 TaxID=3391832 RepID=UPI0039C97C36